MALELDHLILAVNDRSRSIEFYTRILGLQHDGEDGPFSILRVTPGFVILIAPRGTEGGEHLAFALSKGEFESVFARIREAGLLFGDAFDSVGSMRGPSYESGARGMGRALYFFDPDAHLIEIRHYESGQPPAEIRSSALDRS